MRETTCPICQSTASIMGFASSDEIPGGKFVSLSCGHTFRGGGSDRFAWELNAMYKRRYPDRFPTWLWRFRSERALRARRLLRRTLA